LIELNTTSAKRPRRKRPGGFATDRLVRKEGSPPKGRSRDLEELTKKERDVPTSRRQAVALFADRSSRRWIVRDPEGNFWVLPPVENSWDHREPIQPTDEAAADFERVPGHYKAMLGLPF
jgi:hypothetical protein